MNLVLTGGAVSPVAKALLSPGMLSSPPPPPTAAPLTPTPMPTPAAHPHPPSIDPLVAAAMQAQAIAQIRQSQESAWLINQIAVAQAQQQQQQQQALALAAFSKQHQPWAPEYMTAIPPPSMGLSTAAPTSVTSKPHMTFPGQYFPQVAPAPYFVLNFPPRMPPPAYYPKIQAAPQMSPYAQYSPLTIMPPNPAGAVPSAAPQSMVNLKRSWEQAFPAVSAAEATANAAKRQFAAAVSTAPTAAPAAPLPPPPPSPQLAYQPTQFYAGL